MIGVRKFRLVLADACGGGTRDEAPRVSAWEANDAQSGDSSARDLLSRGRTDVFHLQPSVSKES